MTLEAGIAAGRRLWPGLLGCLVIGTLAIAIELGLEVLGLSVSAIALALLIGMAVAGVGRFPSVDEGARLTVKRGLKAAIVLLGFRFSLGVITAIGSRALLVIAIVIAVSFGVALTVSLAVGVDRRLTVLIGAGTAICGNSAIAAVAPSVRASDKQIAFASATITLLGTLTMLLFPLLGSAIALSDTQFGILAGAGVHDSAQAIASGFLFSEDAGNVATVVKLARTAFLVPIVWVISWLAKRDPQLAGEPGPSRVTGSMVPLFVVGFLVAAVMRTAGDELFVGAAWELVVSTLKWGADVLLVVAMAGVGLRTRLTDLRHLGMQPLVVGLASSVAASGAALGAIGVIRAI